jgi:hypothetical protein
MELQGQFRAAGAFAPLHRRQGACLPLDPAGERSCPLNPRPSAMPRWTGNQGALPPDTPAPGIRARHHDQGALPPGPRAGVSPPAERAGARPLHPDP